MISSLISSVIHGNIDSGNEELNESPRRFYKLLEEPPKTLYPGCKEATKVSFIVQLFQIKCMYGMSNANLQDILHLFSLVLPEGHCIPNTIDKVQRVVRDLGLNYVKIHACANDCVLFWKKNEKVDTCPTCGKSRWKMVDGAKKGDEATKTDAAKKLSM